MAKGFKAGAAGSPLNFRVVGGTAAPENPRENTVWVNTDAQITGYVFSAEQPETPAEGMVWFPTGTGSVAPFNALKKNTLLVSPVSALQYLSGVWARLGAEVFLKGAWVSLWDGYAYQSGNEYPEVTGGWKGYPYRRLNEIWAAEPNVSKNADSMTVSIPGIWWNPSQNANNWYSGTLFTEEKIDLSAFSKLYINVISASGNTDKVWLGVSSDKKDCFTVLGEVVCGTVGENILDVSAINGPAYIYVAIHFPQNFTAVTFDKIWLE